MLSTMPRTFSSCSRFVRTALGVEPEVVLVAERGTRCCGRMVVVLAGAGREELEHPGLVLGVDEVDELGALELGRRVAEDASTDGLM